MTKRSPLARADANASPIAAAPLSTSENGMSPTSARQQALMVMDRTIGAQASVLAFSKIYILSGIVLMFSIPLMLFWKHGRGRIAMQAH